MERSEKCGYIGNRQKVKPGLTSLDGWKATSLVESEDQRKGLYIVCVHEVVLLAMSVGVGE